MQKDMRPERMTTAGPMANRTPEVASAQQRMSGAVEQLEGTAKALFDRLGPILSQDKPSSCCGEKDPAFGCNLAAEIQGNEATVRRVIDLLQNALERLEV